MEQKVVELGLLLHLIIQGALGGILATTWPKIRGPSTFHRLNCGGLSAASVLRNPE